MTSSVISLTVLRLCTYDDILIYSKDLPEHVSLVLQVLQILFGNKLYVKAEKCEFHVSTVSFLGYVIQGGQVKMDPAKIKAVAKWPRPVNSKQLQQFLGFANFYRHFIRNFSCVAAPLSRLTSTLFTWTPEADLAFIQLKRQFTAPILVQPDPTCQFVVEVDTSYKGVGPVLCSGDRS